MGTRGLRKVGVSWQLEGSRSPEVQHRGAGGRRREGREEEPRGEHAQHSHLYPDLQLHLLPLLTLEGLGVEVLVWVFALRSVLPHI